MTNTVARTNGSKPRPKRAGRKTAVGEYKHKRTGIDVALGLLTPIVGQEFLDKYNLRDPLNRTPALRRQDDLLHRRRHHPSVQARPGPSRRTDPAEDQRQGLLRPDARRRPEAHRRDRRGVRRRDPASGGARRRRSDDLSPGSGRQGRGVGDHRGQHSRGFRRHRRAALQRDQRAGRRGAGLRRHGPGPADPGAGGVAAALTHWGSAGQQATYLKEFAGENVPQACVAIAEPQPLFDPTALKTTAVRTPSGYRLDGVKSLVPAAADAELFIVAAQLNGKPALFIVESSSNGLTVKADPSMGIRAAALGRVELDNVVGAAERAAGRGRRHRRRLLRGHRAVPAGLGGAGGRDVARGARLRHPVREGTRSLRRARSPTGSRSRSCAPTSPSNSTGCG